VAAASVVTATRGSPDYPYRPIGPETEHSQQLRPVSFRSKAHPDSLIQYGLIAEEVDRVYSELVIRDETGLIQGDWSTYTIGRTTLRAGRQKLAGNSV
jgi:hypothetical protein